MESFDFNDLVGLSFAGQLALGLVYARRAIRWIDRTVNRVSQALERLEKIQAMALDSQEDQGQSSPSRE